MGAGWKVYEYVAEILWESSCWCLVNISSQLFPFLELFLSYCEILGGRVAI